MSTAHVIEVFCSSIDGSSEVFRFEVGKGQQYALPMQGEDTLLAFREVDGEVYLENEGNDPDCTVNGEPCGSRCALPSGSHLQFGTNVYWVHIQMLTNESAGQALMPNHSSSASLSSSGSETRAFSVLTDISSAKGGNAGTAVGAKVHRSSAKIPESETVGDPVGSASEEKRKPLLVLCTPFLRRTLLVLTCSASAAMAWISAKDHWLEQAEVNLPSAQPSVPFKTSLSIRIPGAPQASQENPSSELLGTTIPSPGVPQSLSSTFTNARHFGARQSASVDAYLAKVLARITVISVAMDSSPEKRELLTEVINSHFSVRSHPQESPALLLSLFRHLRHLGCLPEKIVLMADSSMDFESPIIASLGQPLAVEKGSIFLGALTTPLRDPAAGMLQAYVPLQGGKVSKADSAILFHRATLSAPKRSSMTRVPVRWLEFGYLALGVRAEGAKQGALAALRIDTKAYLKNAFLKGYDRPVVMANASATTREWRAERVIKVETPVWSMVVSPDGKMLAVGGGDHTIRLIDALSGEELQRFSGHTERVSGVVFSPEGERLASASYDGTIRLWQIRSGKELRHLSPGQGEISCLAFSPDGMRLISGGLNRNITLWDLEGGSEIRWFLGHQASVTSVGFSPDGTRIVSGAADNTVRLWDVETGRELRTLRGHSTGVQCVEFSPDGKRIISSSGGAAYRNGGMGPGLDYTVRLWDGNNGEELQRFIGHDSWVLHATLSPDGSVLASGSGGDVVNGRITMPSKDQSVRLWNVQNGTEQARLTGHTDVVTRVAFSPDGKQLFSGSWDGTVRVWRSGASIPVSPATE